MQGFGNLTIAVTGAHGHKGGAVEIKLPLSTGVGGSTTWQG